MTIVLLLAVVAGHPFTEVVGVVIFFGDCNVPIERMEVEVSN